MASCWTNSDDSDLGVPQLIHAPLWGPVAFAALKVAVTRTSGKWLATRIMVRAV